MVALFSWIVVVTGRAPSAAASSGWALTGLAPHMSRVPAALGWSEPTEIQSRCIAPILAGRDVVGQASTGSGKTAAYALPLVQLVAAHPTTTPSTRPLCIVLVPTRELCVQVAAALKAIVAEADLSPLVRVGTVYGGTSRSAEAAALTDPPHVLVATPGRLLDHLEAAHMSVPPGGVCSLVLDEADRLLELGFFEAATAIVDGCAPAQLVLFSATMPDAVLELVDAEMREPHRALLEAEGAQEQMPSALRLVGVRCAALPPGAPLAASYPSSAPTRSHAARLVAGGSADGARSAEADAAELARLGALHSLLLELCAARPGSSALVFCNTRAAAMRAWRYLSRGGEHAGASTRGGGDGRARLEVALLSGELEQQEREQSLFLLRQRAVHALVATDLGARGLDVDGLDLVVNFELPPAWDRVTFVHRAGRTGRADSPGACYSLCVGAEEEAALSCWVQELGTHSIDWADSEQLARAAGHERGASGAVAPPLWSAVRIGAGKRDKLSRGDVLGAVTAVAGLRGEDVGRIEVFSKVSFVGLPRSAADEAVTRLRAGKIKKERRLVSLVRPDRVALRADQGRRQPMTGGGTGTPRPAARREAPRR